MSRAANNNFEAKESLDPFLVAFGAKIRKCRKSVGLTQTQLAGLSGTSQNHIHLIETGKTAPKITTVRSIAKVLAFSGLVIEGMEEISLPESEKIAMHFICLSDD